MRRGLCGHIAASRVTQVDLDYVYERFPAFTVNSEIRKLEARPAAPCGPCTRLGMRVYLSMGF